MGLRITLALALISVASGCAPKAWKTHPMSTPPDRSCRTGSDAGHDVWIWECQDGEHTVIWQFCGGLVGCREAERQDVPCDTTTPYEEEHADELDACRPVPDSQIWR
jgi:hypothetical protein